MEDHEADLGAAYGLRHANRCGDRLRRALGAAGPRRPWGSMLPRRVFERRDHPGHRLSFGRLTGTYLKVYGESDTAGSPMVTLNDTMFLTRLTADPTMLGWTPNDC